MKVAALRGLLGEFAALLDVAGDHTAATYVRDVTSLLGSNDAATVKTVLGKMAKVRANEVSQPTSPAGQRLIESLTSLHGVVAASQAKAAAVDITQLTNILRTCREESISAFVSALHSAPAKRTGEAKTQSTALRNNLVNEYTSLLESTAADNEEFDVAMARLESDKQVRTNEMREIASRFLGYALAAKKARGAALKAIRDHQALGARQEARSRGL